MRSRKQIRKIILVSALMLVLFTVAMALELILMPKEAVPLKNRIVFLMLLNLNIFALIYLALIVGKRIASIVSERRQGIIGHKFKTRIAAFLVILVAIPSGLLFFVAGELGTNYIERFFSPQFKKPIEGALETAKRYYEEERERALYFARYALRGQIPPPEYKVIYYEGQSEGEPMSVTESRKGQMPQAEIVSTENGDIVRASMPLPPNDPRGRVLSVETRLPKEFTDNIDLIKTAYGDYSKLEAWKSPIRANYLLLLGLFTLIIIFSALWVSLEISNWITEPVRKLASATEEVAKGNLDAHVELKRQDELGLLIDSFNNMVHQMKTDKESIERAYRNLDNIVKNIQSGVIYISKDGTVQDLNDSACSILNINRAEVVQKPYSALISSVSSSELSDFVKGIDLKTFREAMRELHVKIGGNSIVLKVSISSIRDRNSEHVGFLVVLDDLTDVVKAQRAMAWQEVARRLAHEIKNPLTPIKLSTERMLKKWREEDPDFGGVFERSTETIIKEVNSLKRLVDAFSKFGKLPSIDTTKTDISTVIDEVINLYIDYKDIIITVDKAGDAPSAMLDPELFRRVFINLFDNAISAMENKGAIHLQIKYIPETSKLSIEVADNGPGIKEEDKERLFLPYFSTKKTGTGLGLAIADRIVADHGGSIRIRDNKPAGSVFVIELPV